MATASGIEGGTSSSLEIREPDGARRNSVSLLGLGEAVLS
jgi:hypothetical protein